MFSIIQKNTNFCNEFMFISLCEFFVVLKYDEINCNNVFGVFYNVFLKCKFWLYEITMNLVF